MTTTGIGTQNSGMIYTASSRIANKAIANRVEANEANRVAYNGVEDRVEANSAVTRRLDIAA